MIQFSLVIIIFINLILALPRLYGGIPSGIDSNSHLFKCLYIYEFTKKFGHFPNWSDAWYGGYPISLFYPPLSYHIVVFVMHFGIPPLLAYKLTEIIFYALVTPLSIYSLAQGLKFKKEVGLLAALLFSGIPEILLNLMRMDRYPNIIAIPLVCLFFAIFLRIKSLKYFFLSYILLGSIMLTHHLTALYISLLFPLFIIYQRINKNKISTSFLIALSVLFCAFILAAFWTFPFTLNLNQLQENPFVNRSILGTHTFFDTITDIKSIGLGQVILMLFTGFIFVISLFKERFESYFKRIFQKSNLIIIIFIVILILILIISHILLQDFLDIIYLTLLGVIILSLIFYIPFFSKINILERKAALIFCFVWFFLFFWLGQGDEALLFQLLPYWQKLDPDRFILFSSIPLAILGGFILDEIFGIFSLDSRSSSLSSFIRHRKILLTIGLIIPLLSVNIIQLNSFTTDTTLYLANHATPNEIIRYFEGQNDYGRILPINCPNWIYSFPVIGSNKSIIDGWYPQGRQLTLLRSIRSYSINDLSLDPNRTEIWSTLIENAENLAIGWILIGDIQYVELVPLKKFTLELHADGIFVYKAKFKISMIDTNPDYLADNFVLRRISPERFVIEAQEIMSPVELIIKEAYFPYWVASVNKMPIEVSRNTDGFIQLKIDRLGEFVIELRYEEQTNLAAGISFLTLFGIPILLEILRRNFYAKNSRRRKLFNL
ncbi:MAG: 6-pyruvoyl-tetrahydropterin synthase-related protein [Promethearchaeota archaeon]